MTASFFEGVDDPVGSGRVAAAWSGQVYEWIAVLEFGPADPTATFELDQIESLLDQLRDVRAYEVNSMLSEVAVEWAKVSSYPAKRLLPPGELRPASAERRPDRSVEGQGDFDLVARSARYQTFLARLDRARGAAILPGRESRPHHSPGGPGWENSRHVLPHSTLWTITSKPTPSGSTSNSQITPATPPRSFLC